MAVSIPSSLITVRSNSSWSPFLSSRGRLLSSSYSSLSSSSVVSINTKLSKPSPIASTFFRPPTPTPLSTISSHSPPLRMKKNPFYILRCKGDADDDDDDATVRPNHNRGFWETVVYDRPEAIENLYWDCDFKHWFVAMNNPGGEGATKQQMIDCYIQTLAKVVGSEEEAKKKIYNVSCEWLYYFSCKLDKHDKEIAMEIAKKLQGMPGIVVVEPKSYPHYFDYLAEELVNGELVESLE